MENTVIPKEKSESALYFKHRSQIDKFTCPVADDSPFGVRRNWVNPKTMEKGSTNEMQLSKIEGKWVDARIHTQEWAASGDRPARKEVSLLLSLNQNDLVKVLKLPVMGKKGGISRDFAYFAKRCETIDPTQYSYFETWMPPSSEYAVLMYKQDVGEKWPQTRKCNYWNKKKECYEGLPDLVESEGLGGEKEYDSKERDKYLYGVVEAFCQKVQDVQKPVDSETAKKEDVEEDVQF